MDEKGEKYIKIYLKEMKFIIKYEILMKLFQFFTDNFPEYSLEQKDKPYHFDPDLNNSPKFDIKIYVVDSVFVFQ